MTEPYSLKFGQSAIVYSPARAFEATAFPSGGVGMIGNARDYLRFAEAIRTGDMIAAGESGLKLNEQFPQRYARSAAIYASRQTQPAATKEGTIAR